INELIDTFKLLIPQIFKLSIEEQEFIEFSLYDHFNELKDTLWLYLEYPYVDKVYRNSYYSYYSSKHKDFDRNCIRISLFDSEISDRDFRDNERIPRVQKCYLGYIVIRPTSSCLIGRSMISPGAMKNDNFLCCLVKDTSLINGLLLTTAAFPHSSQDQETITCAETTIWSIMEYFGNKYSDYTPVLPSGIINVLKNISTERLLPSTGLSAAQISFALKEFGFGTKMYSKGAYAEDELKRIFNYYIESGIPVITSLQNPEIGHAVIYCGHENFDPNKINHCPVSRTIPRPEGNPLKIYDTADIDKKFVIIDDNHCPYRVSSFENPTEYYLDPAFDDCEIDSIIVPLYPKIYLEAINARKIVDFILGSNKIGMESDSVVIRFFLTSSRSFKTCINLNTSFDTVCRELILSSTMPKFIWVAELSSKNLYKQKKAFGYIIIDSTGTESMESIIFIVFSNQFMTIENNRLQIHKRNYSKLYDIYENNLKGRWNKWQG
ncbi:MAG: hypothetical protein GY754_04240, partial [bacterium]|nr:hypothetical protein [bacterium]